MSISETSSQTTYIIILVICVILLIVVLFLIGCFVIAHHINTSDASWRELFYGDPAAPQRNASMNYDDDNNNNNNAFNDILYNDEVDYLVDYYPSESDDESNDDNNSNNNNNNKNNRNQRNSRRKSRRMPVKRTKMLPLHVDANDDDDNCASCASDDGCPQCGADVELALRDDDREPHALLCYQCNTVLFGGKVDLFW
jgi:lipopolysaccharide export LptBFGC system permease protein LptF